MSADLDAVATSFRFLRPLWLLGLLAIPPLLWWLRRRRGRGNVWRAAVDAHLLPHLLQNDAGGRGRGALAPAAAGLAATLALLAMAGPSWREVPQPLWQDRNPLVIAVDLSSATFADDVPPSRLLQARAKIAQILRTRGGQVALIAFAEDAYTVSPLTDDAANVTLFVDALSPEVMPNDGSRADRAIEESVRLLERAGFARGDILLITDHPGGSANAAAIDARSEGYRVSVLGLGAVTGGRYRDRRGASEVARLEDGALRTLAASGGGTYAAFAPGDVDLRALGVLDADRIDVASAQDKRGAAPLDEGFWLLPPLLLLALFAFRRGVLAVLLLALWLPWQPATAADLWRREDQRQHAAMARGVEAYRDGDYAAAEAAWRDLPGADAAYNRGNALAKQGRYDDAIAEYDRALQLQPQMPDAARNRQLVDAARRRQQDKSQQDKSQQDKSQQDKAQQDKAQQDKAQQDKAQQDKAQQDKAQQDKAQQDKAQQDKAQQDKPQQDKPQQDKPQQDKPQQGKPQQDKAQQDKAQQDKAQQDKAQQDKAQQDKPQGRPHAPSPPGDPQAEAREQRAADAALRERMQRAAPAGDRPRLDPAGKPGETAAERERRIANEAWLRRVPDDPGGLLRAKFILEQKRRRREGDR